MRSARYGSIEEVRLPAYHRVVRINGWLLEDIEHLIAQQTEEKVSARAFVETAVREYIERLRAAGQTELAA